MGAGLGLVVAPMVGTVLGRVPPGRSGMAAAAVTAAREVGGVIGVTVLGAILYGRLFTGLTHRLEQLGIPVHYRAIVIDAVRKGTKIPTVHPPAGPAGDPTSLLNGSFRRLAQPLIHRTVDAGHAGHVRIVPPGLVGPGVGRARGRPGV